jgi:hypothetical protein
MVFSAVFDDDDDDEKQGQQVQLVLRFFIIHYA